MKVKHSQLLVCLLLFFTLSANLTIFAQDSLGSDEEFGEFKAFDENESTTDEFNTVDESSDEFKEINDDEFHEFNEEEKTSACQHTCSNPCTTAPEEKAFNKDWYWLIGILSFTILAGIFVQFKKLRNFRNIFLLISLFLLGFYKGGCIVCPINGLQNGILAIAGYEISILDIFWIIAIIPITYLLGRVYCGWICHLGALQEFLYLPAKFKILRTATAQRILRISRSVLLIALIVQLVITGTKYWCRIDPFLNIFGFQNFYTSIIGLTSFDFEIVLIISLVVLLLVSSVLTYRPFCRSMCPVGFVLGLITKIPGASVVGIKGECAGCKVCSKACTIDAILHKEKHSTLRNFECISCGDCIDACNKKGLHFFRKSKKHPTTIECKSNCIIEK